MPLQIIKQDISKMQVDAIVNTTNQEMIGYSGVDLAIHTGAGPLLELECAKIAPLGLGTAKITKGYNLDAKYIIHTSGPIWQGGLVGESIILKSCYIESLKLALKYNCNSVAFPLISSGVYGYPKDQVLKFAVQVITEFLFDHELMVYLCVFDSTSYEFSKKLFTEISNFLEEDCGEIYHSLSYKEPEDICCSCSFSPTGSANKSLDEYMQDMDKPFAYKLFDLIDKRGMSDVVVTQTGCIGLCQYEPIVEVYVPGKEKVTYVKMNVDKALEMLEQHIVRGYTLGKYTLNETTL